MATYDNDLRLKEITTGDEDGTWGTSTNTNLELITDALGYGTKAFAADSNETFTMPDATADGTRSLYLKFTSGVSLTSTRTATIGPNTISKVWMVENATSGSQSIIIKQGSGAEVTIATGAKAWVYTDGAGAGAAVALANPTETGTGTVTSVQVAGGTTGLSYSGGPITGSGTITTAGTLVVANGGTGGTTSTGSGAVVLATSPTLVTPALGTPSSGTATNLTGLPAAGVVGTAAILGANTFTALQTEAAGADIASATATDLTAATGNTVVITGTTPATSLTMTAGQQMILIAAAAWPLTFHATTMNIVGGVSYTCAAGDRLYVTKDVDNVIRVSVNKQDGTSVVAAASDATQTLVDGATVNWDMASGNIGLWAIGGNRALAAPTNLVAGSSVLRITQDVTGSRTVTWNAIFKWSAGTAPVLSTAGGAIDILSFVYDGTNLYGTLALRGAA